MQCMIRGCMLSRISWGKHKKMLEVEIWSASLIGELCIGGCLSTRINAQLIKQTSISLSFYWLNQTLQIFNQKPQLLTQRFRFLRNKLKSWAGVKVVWQPIKTPWIQILLKMRVQTLILDLLSKKRLPDQTLSQTQPNPNNLLELILNQWKP